MSGEPAERTRIKLLLKKICVLFSKEDKLCRGEVPFLWLICWFGFSGVFSTMRLYCHASICCELRCVFKRWVLCVCGLPSLRGRQMSSYTYMYLHELRAWRPLKRQTRATCDCMLQFKVRARVRWLLQPRLCTCMRAERPLHSMEIIAEVIKKWSSWPEEFCHRVHLCAKHNYVYANICTFVRSTVCTLDTFVRGRSGNTLIIIIKIIIIIIIIIILFIIIIIIIIVTLSYDPKGV